MEKPNLSKTYNNWPLTQKL